MDAADGIINDGSTATVKYLTGYVVEKSLSVQQAVSQRAQRTGA